MRESAAPFNIPKTPAADFLRQRLILRAFRSSYKFLRCVIFGNYPAEFTAINIHSPERPASRGLSLDGAKQIILRDKCDDIRGGSGK